VHPLRHGLLIEGRQVYRFADRPRYVRRLSGHGGKLAWSAVAAFHGLAFLAFSVWLTFQLPEMLPPLVSLGFDWYLLMVTGAFYILAVFLLVAGLTSLGRAFGRRWETM